MDLIKEWQNSDIHQDPSLSALLDMPLITKLSSNDPLQKIKHAILANTCWAAVIGCGYLFVAFRFPFWQIISGTSALVLITISGIIQNISLYKSLTQPISANSLLQGLEKHYYNIKKWMTIQQRGGLLMYPISITWGFILGWQFGSGKPIGPFIQKPSVAVTLLILLAILVPVCYRLAKWMSEKAFGQYATQLKQNIDALKIES